MTFHDQQMSTNRTFTEQSQQQQTNNNSNNNNSNDNKTMCSPFEMRSVNLSEAPSSSLLLLLLLLLFYSAVGVKIVD